MHLHKGEVLFDYYSPELQSAAAELIYAARALRAAGGESDVHRHEIQTRVAGARQQLTVRDVADRDIDALIAADHEPVSIPIRSPASGELMDKMVVQGASVQMGSKVMRIEDHGKLWLDAEIFENQMTGVAVGAPVTATFDALPGRSISSKVSLVFPHVDQVTRTEIVRSVLDPADSALKPGMYAMVNIVTEPVTDAVLIPREAVIDSGSRQVVFVALDGGHFQARQVHVGITGDNDQVQILDGIAEGEPVVTSGQFLLDVESRTLEAIDKLQQPSDPATQPGELIKGAMP
jgi:RND family efflux transporter MFP subunit